MPEQLTAELRASLAWLFQDSPGLSTVVDVAKLEYLAGFEAGTDEGQVDRLWHDEREVLAGANDDLVLSDLAGTIFGHAIDTALVTVKALLIVNTADEAGDDLLIGGAASHAWSAPFADSGDKVKLPADSALLLVNRKDGWAVAAGSSDVLRIANPGASAVTYRIAIVGTSE